MSITVETGAGILSAESYVSVTDCDTYWGKRTHTAFYTTWNGATTPFKEGALREASSHLDSSYSSFYLGVRKGFVQGLEWPRTDALDKAGYPLPDLPPQLVDATCELAARALSSYLSSDASRGGAVKRNKVEGAVEQEFFEGAQSETKYGVIESLLAVILNGSQGGFQTWNWR